LRPLREKAHVPKGFTRRIAVKKHAEGHSEKKALRSLRNLCGRCVKKNKYKMLQMKNAACAARPLRPLPEKYQPRVKGELELATLPYL
jgi:hypothetical protein